MDENFVTVRPGNLPVLPEMSELKQDARASYGSDDFTPPNATPENSRENRFVCKQNFNV